MAKDGEYVPRLLHLPGTMLTPEVVLHRTLNKIDRIKAVAIIITWDDDTYATDWSQQKISLLCMGAVVLDENIRRIINGEGPPCEPKP